MLRGISRIVTHGSAGAVWSLVAIGLATALVVTNVQSHRKEDFLRGRIAALASHDASQLQAQLVSCHATVRSYAAAQQGGGRSQATQIKATQIKATGGDPASRAAELTDNSPAGFDVCARMESADQAVLKALDRR
ncbi:MAG: hypothetical protein JWP49_2902 [Phenylobacterium sp.]|nr:hypothetical protein [Phenylobacterium sp.]